MPDDINQEVLRGLKSMNERIEKLESGKGLSAPMKILALILGFMIIGPLAVSLIGLLFN
ncbi:hypothetical protein [Metabacillus sp. FJAT-52054]|uniref:Uncharacterized protein n=1 Tax=Metabacillus sediminis TaxID=3117746 RepID=A0ABZ2NH34_9BACI